MIAATVRSGEVVISPFDVRRSRPASQLLSLGNRFVRAEAGDAPIDPFRRSTVEAAFGEPFPADTVELSQGEFILGATDELVALSPRYSGRITGMSHLARLGLAVHVTSDLISPGFGFGAPTAITLELVNQHPRPVLLRSGMPICHLQIHALETASARSYDQVPSGYNGSAQPTVSRYWAEFTVGEAGLPGGAE
ncbi:deoxycytidine triphosphate deaminase [Amycolatopsis decaplanina DSM 44594]|uniref:Deoxycytidine triphosphate deaminase n=1 Tax=Amycolatopsis decaplanina DSM 44594 TaxID=1284240 RepID=M2Y7T1_9PSEU|nr:deoxycytidine triphosphate deaminase [Amycolatopsis decaplanina DSM 44594]